MPDPYNEVLVVTNRVGNPLDSNYAQFKNFITPNGKLKYFVYNSQNKKAPMHQLASSSEFTSKLITGYDWVLYIHGDSRTIEEAISRGIEIQHEYKVKLIVFSWPSKMKGTKAVKNLKNTLRNVTQGVPHFLNILDILAKYKHEKNWPGKGQSLSLFFHSLGNYYIEVAAKESFLEKLPANLFDNLILNAAAVNEKGHIDWLKKVNIQKRIYVNSNKRDFMLNGLRIFTRKKKLLGERIKPPVLATANYVNFTKAIGMTIPHFHSHNYFIDRTIRKSTNIRQYYSDLFHGKKVDLSKRSIFSPRKNGTGYNINYKN
jgi:hypothetical protein